MRLEVMKACSSKQWSDVKTEPLTSGYRVDTHVLKIGGSNPPVGIILFDSPSGRSNCTVELELF